MEELFRQPSTSHQTINYLFTIRSSQEKILSEKEVEQQLDFKKGMHQEVLWMKPWTFSPLLLHSTMKMQEVNLSITTFLGVEKGNPSDPLLKAVTESVQ